MSTQISTALSATQGNGTGWINASALAGNAPRRAELSSNAVGGAAPSVVEIWASNDNTGAVNYVGSTPPSGRLVGKLTGPNSTEIFYPNVGLQPNGTPQGANNAGCQATYYNYIRTSPDVGAANVLLSGEIAASPAAGTPIVNGGQGGLGGQMLIGTNDAEPLLLEANNIVGYNQTAAGALTLGTQAVGQTTTVQSGGEARLIGTTAAQPGPVTGRVRITSAADTVVTAGTAFTLAASTQIELAAPGVAVGPALVVPDASAGLDLSTFVTKGLGLPQVPDATFRAIVSPLTGLMVLGSTNKIGWMNTGTPGSPVWTRVSGGNYLFAQNTSVQSIADAATFATYTGWTAVATGGPAGAFVPSTGVFTATVPGDYAISASAQLAATAAMASGDRWAASIFQNATEQQRGEFDAVAAATTVRSASSSCILSLAAGDTVVVKLSQTSGGGAQNTTNVAPANTLSIQQVN